METNQVTIIAKDKQIQISKDQINNWLNMNLIIEKN